MRIKGYRKFKKYILKNYKGNRKISEGQLTVYYFWYSTGISLERILKEINEGDFE